MVKIDKLLRIYIMQTIENISEHFRQKSSLFCFVIYILHRTIDVMCVICVAMPCDLPYPSKRTRAEKRKVKMHRITLTVQQNTPINCD